MSIISRGNPWQKGTRIEGLPTQALTALAATDDGSLFIGTAGSGLWRMDADKNLSRLVNVPGRTVKQLLYDPNGTPAMLYVLTDAGLTVLRGH
jgi:ligand-binding sensor domain-containing protein